MGRVGRFVLGGILIGASFALGPGFSVAVKAALLSTGLSFASNAVFDGAGSARRQMIEIMNPDNQAPVPVVYGKTKLGLRLADMRVGGPGGPNNKFLYIVGALCHGSIDGNGISAIDQIYFDDTLAIDQSGQIQPRFQGKLVFAKYMGTDAQTIDPTMGGAFPTEWPATSKGRGVAYIVLRLTADNDVYPTGIPNVTVILRGLKVLDPRVGGAFAYSTNPALQLYDYLTSNRYGMGTPTTEIDTTSFNTMANYYDEVITKDSTLGTTGKRFEANGYLDVGQSVQANIRQLLTSCRGNLIFEGGKYRLFTRRVVTPTTFALNETNIVGGCRIRTVNVPECPNQIRYTFTDPAPGPFVTAISASAPVAITTATPHNFVRDQRVLIYEHGAVAQGLSPTRLGVYTIASITSPTVFVLADNFDPGAGYNASSCRVTHEAFSHPAETRYWPRPDAVNGYLTEDNNYEVIADAEFPMTQDPHTAEQLALVTMKEQRAGLVVELTATEAALELQVGDLTPIAHSTPGWPAIGDPAAGRLFWIMGLFLLPTAHVRVVALQYDANAYTLDALTTFPARPATSLPDPRVCQPPSDILLTAGDAEARVDLDGSKKAYIKASWTASTDPHLEYYEVQYRASGSTTWLPSSDPNRSSPVSQIGPLSEGVSYDVQVRAVNTLGVPSDWITDSATPQLTGRSGAKWVDAFTTTTPGRRWIQKGGIGTFVDVADPDGQGESVGRAKGPVWMEYADSFPYDPTQDYVLSIECRQNRDPAIGSKECYLGFAAVAQVPGQPGVYTYLNTLGQDSFENQHFVLMDGGTLEAGREWTVITAYIKGHAGGKAVVTSDMLTNSGLGNFNAANCVDGDTTPSKVAFDTNTAVAGASLLIDHGVPKAITGFRMHMGGPGSAAAWALEVADSPSGPWTRIAG